MATTTYLLHIDAPASFSLASKLAHRLLHLAVEMIDKILEAGMDVAHFNFSRGNHEYHRETLEPRFSALSCLIP
ncbi:Ketopantoate hydroxymethyltransferase, partial [Trema orientale]